MVILVILFFILLILIIILSIAFVTLYERHLLGLRQNRLGPNKIFLVGILQAALDGVKLISKEQVLPINRSDLYFLLIPGVCFIFMFFE